MERAAAGASIILTTHILDVAERLATRIGILSGGSLLAEGTMQDLLRRTNSQVDATLEDVFLILTAERPVEGSLI
jgi:ABC-2 type transport system ATP-binding protein